MQERFETLLERHGMETDPARRADLERLIWQEFGCERAVLVLDMADFTRLSQQYGLVHYLSMIQRMRRIAAPVVVRKEGVILKFEADNAFVMFPDVEPALQCAFELDLAFREANRATPDELDIRIACGIDHGPILVVPGRDFWGQAVIRASKLGEDLAEPGEVLLTTEAAARLRDLRDWHLAPSRYEISGVRLEAVRVRCRGGDGLA